MNSYNMIKIKEHPEYKEATANWFHQKWNIPLDAYTESIDQCLTGQDTVPQWYIVMDGSRIIAGLGVIENDFHDRKDLTPNVCAVYVEPDYRCRGIAGKMLDFVCKDMNSCGISTLYLVTDHTSFYERYGFGNFVYGTGRWGSGDEQNVYHKNLLFSFAGNYGKLR